MKTPYLLATLALVVALPSLGRAQTARAYLSQSEVAVNRQFVLNVEVFGAQQVDGTPTLPDLGAFAIYLGSSTSSSMQVINGQTSTSLTIQYRYQATEQGRFQIGPVTLTVGGQSLSTDPLIIQVVGAPPPSGPTGRSDQDDSAATEDLFITATASKQRVYVNEPVIIEYRIFTRVNVEGLNVTELPGTVGFWVEELPNPRRQTEQVMRNNVQYASSVIRRVALFATSAGPKTVDPLTLEAQVRVQRRRGGRRVDPFGNPFDSFFGRDLFGSRVAVIASSNTLEIDVAPLPATPPDSYTGLVGQLRVSTEIDRTEANTNDALTLRLEIAGNGNIRTLPEPELDIPTGFELYPPDITEHVEPTTDGVRGRKIFEYVIVPRTPGQMTIPPVEMAYLDSEQGTYIVAGSDPIVVTVSGEVPTEVGGSGGRVRGGIDLQRQDIRFIRIATPSFRVVGASLPRTFLFWTVLLTPLLAVAGAIAARRHRDRLTGDVAYARRRRASRVARQRLTRAEALRSPEQHREFHNEVGRAMQGFLGDKLNVAEAGLIHDEVRASLAARHVGSVVVDAYLSCLQDCDRERFAPTEPNVAAMQDMLTRAGRAMTDLDQGLS